MSSGMDARSSAEGVVCPAISRLMRTSSRSVFSPKVGKGMSRGAAISSAEAMQTAQRPRSATRIWTIRLPYRTAHHLASAKKPTGNVSASAQSIGDSDVFQLEARFISGEASLLGAQRQDRPRWRSVKPQGQSCPSCLQLKGHPKVHAMAQAYFLRPVATRTASSTSSVTTRRSRSSGEMFPASSTEARSQQMRPSQ